MNSNGQNSSYVMAWPFRNMEALSILLPFLHFYPILFQSIQQYILHHKSFDFNFDSPPKFTCFNTQTCSKRENNYFRGKCLNCILYSSKNWVFINFPVNFVAIRSFRECNKWWIHIGYLIIDSVINIIFNSLDQVY